MREHAALMRWTLPVAWPTLPCARHAPIRAQHSTSYHAPVLCDATIKYLVTNPAGTYADGTLGGGGHSEALLEVLAPRGGRLISLDRDPDALREASARLERFAAGGHAAFVHANFATLADRLPAALRTLGDNNIATAESSAPPLDGLLLDLGVSSYQLDTAERGFSFMRDGPLDMRMDQSSGGGALTAATILNEWPANEIANVIWRYGEERTSRRIAQAIVAARPLGSTADLAAALKAAAPPGPPKLASKMAARVFQALRIAVNGELDELDAVLSAAAALVRPGGRLAVLSYHSLEDRRVKRLLRSGTLDGDAPPTDLYGKSLAVWAPVTRQPITASDDEVSANSRARSARLRVGERTEVPLSG